MRAFVVCCSLLASAAPAVGTPLATFNEYVQQEPQDTTRQDTLRVYQLLGIIVTVPRTDIPLREVPAATNVVDSTVLDATPRSIAADEALRLVPGVKVDNQANGERVHMSIRGQGILAERGLRGIKVLLDGLPLNDPSGFAPDLFDVDWSNVDRIEVLRGPGASLYGGGATAGVLNIVTPAVGEVGVVGAPSAELRYGSHNFWKAAGRVDGRPGDFGYRLSASRTKGDGYRDHTAFSATNLYAKGEWAPSQRLRLRPIVGWTDYFNQNAEGLNLDWLAEDRRQANPDALIYNEFQQTRRLTGGFTGTYDLHQATALEFNAYVRNTHYKESVPSSVHHRTLTPLGATVQLTQRLATGGIRHVLGAGSDVQWQWISEFRHPNLGGAEEGPELLADQTIRQSGLGIFLFDRLDLGRAWSGMVNLRYDRVTNELSDELKSGGIDLSGNADFNRATVRLGLAYSPSPYFGAYANWGQGFLPPATEELANNPEAQGGFNLSLEPALSHGEEAGVRGILGRRVLYDLTLFHLETRGDFDRYRVESRPLETFYRNGGNSRRFGAELFASLNPVDPIWLQVAYTWSHFIYLSSTSFYGDIEGNWLPNSPEHQLFTDLSWNVRRDLTVAVGTDSFSHWYVDASNTTSVDGYALLNARVAWRFSLGSWAAELSLQGRNLTGVKYIAFTEPDPDGNSYQPGPEEELFTGLRVSLP